MICAVGPSGPLLAARNWTVTVVSPEGNPSLLERTLQNWWVLTLGASNVRLPAASRVHTSVPGFGPFTKNRHAASCSAYVMF